MSTKVKGDAIKEGSIPLSALASEVKDKIENAGGGADWNADFGENGYIINKPFGFSKVIRLKDLNPKYYYDEDENEICEAIMPLSGNFDIYTTIYQVSGGAESVIGRDYFKIKQNVDFLYGFSKYMNPVKYSLYSDEDGNYIIKLKSSIIDDSVELENSVFIVDTEGGEGCATIPDLFIPNTVIKTTPQTLTNTNKNQALTNLGIDPVVWKYMCNPYVITDNPDSRILPEELNPYIEIRDESSDIYESFNPIVAKLLVYAYIDEDGDGSANIIPVTKLSGYPTSNYNGSIYFGDIRYYIRYKDGRYDLSLYDA